ncbi:NAD(P)H-dependent oxidoreductase [Flavobacteriaceae bacterium XHP0103]|uniref:NAD(P)H-dependent oxidoreductase n=1 Tax=Marixanthotalea marina TaxID=2844359 RepID=UPI002989A5AB|nr:NAD(P)H-dependent oxidoreductase [Marixanthotalea marina]MBU3822947.1 NAD(P)H-dependent oxidoreductase [Marixanthotalea marina]
MDVIKHLEWRYATKKFDKTNKLSASKLMVLKEAFNLTATSFGLQTINMLVVESADLRKLLLPHTYNQPQIVDASHLLVICIKETIEDDDVNDYFDNIKDVRNTSETILNPYRQNLIKTMKKMTQKEQQQWSLNQAYIALGNLMTVCAIEQIDSCPMEGFVPEKYDEVLNLKEKGLKSVLLLPVGYRAKDDMFADFKKVRKKVKETVFEL